MRRHGAEWFLAVGIPMMIGASVPILLAACSETTEPKRVSPCAAGYAGYVSLDSVHVRVGADGRPDTTARFETVHWCR